ncbi:hypothetical protein [Streptomyces sp. NBC_01768]|uniref:hypothetical protein n=1 Tax=Streptomyces sp. NBC_01768 TaxID=2975938 RepID=UPI002DDC57EE|nr:hypothetical protein [Streptomyces sp. NBC_01768]WSC29627.1 hypothetical protein OG902_24670 [Streptomyces sp. NBC_01768]
MALVHVHGIGNRKAETVRRSAPLRDELLRRHLLPATGHSPGALLSSPWWGELVTEPAWGWASLAPNEVESLGGESEEPLEEVLAETLAEGPERWDVEQVLTATARVSLQRAIDLIALAGNDEESDSGSLAELVAFCARATVYWAEKSGEGSRGDGVAFFAWLGDIEEDDEFLDRLHDEVADWEKRTGRGPAHAAPRYWESLGVESGLPARAIRAMHRLRALHVSTRTRPLAAGARRVAARPAALLLGDVMGYFAERGTRKTPGRIVERIASSLDEAARDAAVRGEPLVVLAHSMGGNIVHDVLSHFRPDVRVDLLVTVGTQISLFEELKLFASSDHKVPNPRCPKVAALPNVGRWLNVLDRSDPLAFAAAPVFAGAEDLVFRTGAWWAHGGYLTSCDFHVRLARRVGLPT